ncbi:hypothetical protein MKW94_020466 [Papaver nudicaule]|uniref:Uncharacterized protein n=1 Tax=Papaver nudicaule TaxID=74823 RepID=A0AA41SJS8_PAPNU|nr:hypothetical protein [Papaver nudicaule]
MEMSTSFLGTSSSSSFAKPIVYKNFHGTLPINTSRRVLTVTCFNPKPGDDNNNKPEIHADWRSFRAKLVTSERSSKPRGTLNLMMNPKLVEEHHVHAPNEVSWTHILEQPEKGCLLIATQKLDGVNIFKDTVILILSIDSDFSTGIILNKPSSLTSAVTNTVDAPLYFGGPLDEKLVLLNLKKKRNECFERVLDGLYYGTKQESLCCVDVMVKRNEIGVQDFRVLEGYCRWTNKVLRDEIRTGHWKVMACSPNVFSPLHSQEIQHNHKNN